MVTFTGILAGVFVIVLLVGTYKMGYNNGKLDGMQSSQRGITKALGFNERSEEDE